MHASNTNVLHYHVKHMVYIYQPKLTFFERYQVKRFNKLKKIADNEYSIIIYYQPYLLCSVSHKSIHAEEKQ